MWNHWSRCLCCATLCVSLWAIATPPQARAQGFTSCRSSGGIFSAMATLYVGAPNVVFLVGNAVRIAKRPSKIWGVTGIITGSLASFAQLAATYGDLSPNCGDHYPILAFGSVMLAIHAATVALGIANTVAVDQKRANAPPPPFVRRRRRGRWRERRGQGPRERQRQRERRWRREQQAPKATSAKLTCKDVYKIYRDSLRDLAHNEDSQGVLQVLLTLERNYFPCFFTKAEGRKLRRLRRKRLGDPSKKKTPPSADPPAQKPDGTNTKKPVSSPTRAPLPLAATDKISPASAFLSQWEL